MWGQDNEAIPYNSASVLLPILTLSANALRILISHGTVKGQGRLKAVPNSDKTSKVPYVDLRVGETGVAVGLFKIGFENPDGDQSDKSKPRLVVTQSAGNYPADQYFYRQ